jgi:hypothetical protein
MIVATMVSFHQHIILPARTQVYIGLMILILSLLVFAMAFVGSMIHQLSVVIRGQTEILRVGVGYRVQPRVNERKNE